MEGVKMYKLMRFYTFFQKLFLEKNRSLVKQIAKALKKNFSRIKISLVSSHLLKAKTFDNNYALFMNKCINSGFSSH